MVGGVVRFPVGDSVAVCAQAVAAMAEMKSRIVSYKPQWLTLSAW